MDINNLTQPVDLGYRVTTPLVSLTATSTPSVIVNVPTNWTAILLKVAVYNSNPTVGAVVQFGDSSFTQRMPSLYVDMGADRELDRDDLTEWEFTHSIQVQETAAAAGGTPVQVQVTVLVRPGNAVST